MSSEATAAMDSPEPKPLGTRSKAVESIEELVCRKVAIETVESEASIARCHPQNQCPLFSTLPRELREIIWAFAASSVEDKDNKYSTNEYYYRPGHTARFKTYTDLLLTCRRVWLEAHAYPMLQAEHCFWYYRAAPDARSSEWMAKLTRLNRQNFGHLHLFAQMYAIEGLRSDRGALRNYFLKTPQESGDFQPRLLHVTIRHTDWWDWEYEAPLRLQDRFVQALLDTEDLRSTQYLKLELETLDYKMKQLLPIVERLKRLESKEFDTHVISGQPARTKFIMTDRPKTHEWVGPVNIDGEDFEPYADKKQLNYVVVTLTWQLHFPQFPHAHIPHLRLMPRLGEDAPFCRSAPVNIKAPEIDEGAPVYISRRRRHHELFRLSRVEAPNTVSRWGHYVHKMSQWQAEAHEGVRRQRFCEAMGDLYAVEVEKRWRAERSLLKLERHSVTGGSRMYTPHVC